MDWPFFVQQVVNGVTLGSLYSLIALGWTMVYGLLKVLHFAHGEVYMIGSFIGYGVLTLLGGPLAPVIPVVPLIILMFLAAMLGSGVLGVMIERFAYRPLRDAPRMSPFIAALGVAFFLQSAALLLFTADIRSYDTFDLAGGTLFESGIHTSWLNISLVRMIVIGTTLALMVALTLFISRTRFGKAMRATSFDHEAAAMMGIDINRVVVVTFFVVSVLAGAAGVMAGLVFQRVYHFMGFIVGLKGFTGAVIGGLGSIPGAIVGGLTIGLTEAFATGYISSTFSDLVVFGILIGVLILRPSGLLGKGEVQRA